MNHASIQIKTTVRHLKHSADILFHCCESIGNIYPGRTINFPVTETICRINSYIIHAYENDNIITTFKSLYSINRVGYSLMIDIVKDQYCFIRVRWLIFNEADEPTIHADKFETIFSFQL